MKTLKIALCTLCAAVAVFLAPMPTTFALNDGPTQPYVGNAGGLLPGPDRTENAVNYTVDKLLPKFTNVFLVLIFLLGTPLLICIGLFYFQNEFDNDMMQKAKDGILWFGVGTAIAILGYAIVRIVIGFNFIT